MPDRSSRSLIREYLEALLIAVLFATFVRTYVGQVFKIPSGSMEESLLIGDHIIVNKFIYGGRETGLERVLLPSRDIRRGDVVVFKYPEDPKRDFIKRCMGLPGDRVEIADKKLLVNGQELDEASYTSFVDSRTYPRSIFVHESYRLRDNFGPYQVPEGHFFCLGDNRDESHDSRYWGPVPADYVKGRAFLVYWSFEADEESGDWPGYAGRIRQLSNVAARFFTGTRWERSLLLVR